MMCFSVVSFSHLNSNDRVTWSSDYLIRLLDCLKCGIYDVFQCDRFYLIALMGFSQVHCTFVCTKGNVYSFVPIHYKYLKT